MNFRFNYMLICTLILCAHQANATIDIESLTDEQYDILLTNKHWMQAILSKASTSAPTLKNSDVMAALGDNAINSDLTATQVAQAVNNVPAVKSAGISVPVPADNAAIAAAQAALDKDLKDAQTALSAANVPETVNNTLTDEVAAYEAALTAEQKIADAEKTLANLTANGASKEVIDGAKARVDALKAGQKENAIKAIKAQIADFKTKVGNATSLAELDALKAAWNNLPNAQKDEINAVANAEFDDLVKAANDKSSSIKAAIDTAKAAVDKDVDVAASALGKDSSIIDASLTDELGDQEAVLAAIKARDDAQAKLNALKAAGASNAEIKAAQEKVDALNTNIATRETKEIADIKAQIADLKSKVQTAKSLADLDVIKTAWNNLSDAQKAKVNAVAQAELNDLINAANDKAKTFGSGDGSGSGSSGGGSGSSGGGTVTLPSTPDSVNSAGGSVTKNTDGTESVVLGNVIGTIAKDGTTTVAATGVSAVKSGNNVTLTIKNSSANTEDTRNVLIATGLVSVTNNGSYKIAGVDKSFTKDELNTVIDNMTKTAEALKNTQAAAENTGNTIISNVSAAMTSSGSSNATTKSGFSAVKKAMRGNDRMADRMPNVFNALAENGPVVVDVQKFRFWLSPYASISNLSASSEREKGFGALAGMTYRAAKFSVGFFFGYNTAKNEHNNLNKTGKTDGMSFGLNASANLWKDGVINFLYAYAPSTVKHEQKLGALAAQSEKQKNHAHVIDVNVGHSFKLGSAYALDLSLGNTSVFSKQGTYFGNASTLNGQSQEVYAGFGAAWNKPTQSGHVFVRGSYQFGYQYKNSNKTPNMPLFGNNAVVVQGVNVEKRKSHYVGLSSGMDLNKSWGFSFGYNGTFARKYQNHTVSGRIEYRM